MLYIAIMKSIQITVDDDLLGRLDRDEEVRRDGRSAVFRRAAEAYLRRLEQRRIANAYRRAYGGPTTTDEDLEGWSDEGVWPPE
jgi:predicted transcriptional regulator